MGGLAAVALAAPGQPDPGFGHDGQVIADLGKDEDTVAAAVTGNDRLVVASTIVVGGRERALVARFRRDGAPDARFGEAGHTIIDLPGDEAEATDVAIADDGRILLSADVREADGGPRVAVTRLAADGSVDPSFGTDGTTVTTFGGEPWSMSAAIEIAPDGGLVVAGSAAGDIGVTRLTQDGEPDESFAEDGTEVADFGGIDSARDVAIGPGETVVVGGLTGEEVIPDDPDGWNEDVAVARFRENGELDPGFSGDGLQTMGLSGPDERADAIAVLDDGSVVAAGRRYDSGTGDTLVLRLAPNGEPDPMFGANGERSFDLAGRRGGPDAALDLEVDASGRIVVGGFATTSSRRRSLDFAFARLLPNGRRDRSLSRDGRVSTDLGGRDIAEAVALDGRGRITLVGPTERRGDAETGLARYRAG